MLRDRARGLAWHSWEAVMFTLRWVAFAATAVAGLWPANYARADIMIDVDKSSQRMSVIVDGVPRYAWAVSTGVHGTPSGSFRPQSLSLQHRSSLFGGAPMPYSIFYSSNFAIHGTLYIGQLGARASHGCIRLHPQNAAILFSMVQGNMGATRIHIH
jgi:lipoprotein-anchoring transpeptidase ErfK/SrfK